MKLCVIPARGGSKRIPRKNIREFGGKPMIAWSINSATNSECFDRIMSQRRMKRSLTYLKIGVLMFRSCGL